MSNSVLIHVGYPKCASTYLQREIFKRLPNADENTVYKTTGLKDLLEGAQDLPTAETLERQESVRLVVSQEKLSGNPYGQPFPEIERYARLVRRRFGDAEILLITREQYSYCDSLYRWSVGGDHMWYRSARRFFSMYNSLGEYLCYDRAVAIWTRLFRRVTVIPYEVLRQDPRRFDALIAEWLGIATLHGRQVQNPSLDWDLVPVARATNVLGILAVRLARGRIDTRRLRRLRGRYVLDHVPRWARSQGRPDLALLLADWDARWRRSNARLQERVEFDLGRLGYPL